MPKLSLDLSSQPIAKSKDVPPQKGLEEKLKKFKAETLEILQANVNDVGFLVEKKKSEWFAKQFAELSTKAPKGTLGRFLKGLEKSFKSDAEVAKKKLDAENKGVLTKVSSVAHLAKNVLRPIRLIMDVTGMSPAGAQRLVMAGGMLTSRVLGASKEARFANEKLIEQTRGGTTEADIQKAEEEAWRIYNRARLDSGVQIPPEDVEYYKSGEAGVKHNVTVDALKKAYLKGIPKDLQERLKKDTGAVYDLTQRILRRSLELSVAKLNNNIRKIKENKKLSAEKKKAKTEELLRWWERGLMDYDRALTQAGTVDKFAVLARYGETAAKTLVRAATLQTAYLTLEKVWEGLAKIGASLASQDDFSAYDLKANLKVKELATARLTKIAEKAELAQKNLEANKAAEARWRADTMWGQPTKVPMAPATTEVETPQTTTPTGPTPTLESTPEGAQVKTEISEEKPEVNVTPTEATHGVEETPEKPREFADEEDTEVAPTETKAEEVVTPTAPAETPATPEEMTEEPRDFSEEEEVMKIPMGGNENPLRTESLEELEASDEDTTKEELGDKHKKFGFEVNKREEVKLHPEQTEYLRGIGVPEEKMGDPEAIRQYLEGDVPESDEAPIHMTAEYNPGNISADVDTTEEIAGEETTPKNSIEKVIKKLEHAYGEPGKIETEYLEDKEIVPEQAEMVEEAPVQENITEEIAGNRYDLSPEALQEVDTAYNDALHKLAYGEETKLAGTKISTFLPKNPKIIAEGFDMEGVKTPVHSYLEKVRAITGVKPKLGGWFSREENVEKYLARALQYAAARNDGTLEKLKIVG